MNFEHFILRYHLDHQVLHIRSTLTTHVLQIDLTKLEEFQIHNKNNDNENANDVDNDDNNEKENRDSGIVTGRHRHRRNNMMLAMLFGVTAMGAIVIPVGFQFLSLVAGKALLLSKMALLLASISSLRKIATSGLHYGLYHLQDPYGGYGSYYDRGDAQAPPRFPRSSN
ncbi:uncharacterized protein LOC129611928 [Condylostylus longicornis]|uniref:uncharacterized protein LOC129611928 n=1 Tax=Condylostylus longicornis TaxID=2530218 RepID=UPI00244E4D63|nr:uncharacterized protein LOC129611928 [Condylostylus longicornis]